MRRLLTAASVAALVLSSVGSTLGVEPTASPEPAPIVEPGPTVEPSPSAGATDPAESSDPSPGAPAPPIPDATTSPTEGLAPTSPDAATSSRDSTSADPTGRWIVVLRSGTNVAVASHDQGHKLGFTTDRSFSHAFRGFSAKLDRSQVAALRHDPSVVLIVPDEKIQAEAQTLPTGILRIGARRSPMAQIDGVDQRIDADVAIVDTGITQSIELNVAGGYNCSTSNGALWRDVYGHGTHVAGTVGAIDNGTGVVGVAPGVRLWAVKILNDNGEGLLSWYVCGLDWIAAQHDPNDSTRPLFEAVNMSVTKWGRDDLNCGMTNKDVLHQAICRLVALGVTVVAAAANDSGSASLRVPAAYNEVITVSALADTDGKPGGLGGRRCYSWGSYDSDDTFADFSNFGSDVDLIAPGKCIWSTIPGGYAYMSGTSMATPHVAGAVALLKATRPALTPPEVKEALQYLGNLGWKTSTDPDRYHEKMLDVARLGPRGDFAVGAGSDTTVGAGGVARFPITITRTATSFERIRLSVSHLPDGWTASFDRQSLYGFEGVASTLTVNVPLDTRLGSFQITVTGDEHGNSHAVTATVVVRDDIPTALAPITSPRIRATIGSTTVPALINWAAATDASGGIAGYELLRLDGGGWTPYGSTTASVRSSISTDLIGHLYQYSVRAQDLAGNWSGWADGPTLTSSLIQDRSSAVAYSGTWTKAIYSLASGGTTTYAKSAGARARTTFSGRAVAIVAPLGPTRGSATVYVDGVYRATISFRASSGTSRVVMYSTTFATLGTHTIELRPTGNGRVDLDAFVILR
jgi:subtilisin